MISVNEALKLIDQHLWELPSQELPLQDSLGHVLRENLKADRDSPPFDRVAMDGISLCYEAYDSGKKTFVCEGVQAAGEGPKSLLSTSGCIEVMTGCSLPVGSDCVVRYEDVNICEGSANIADNCRPHLGSNIHPQGSNYKKDDIVLTAGTHLNATHLGLAASIGKATLSVSQRPSIALISTGDELVDVEQTPLPYQIRKSNIYSLQAQLNSHGFFKINTFHFRDDKNELLRRLPDILGDHQVIIFVGGVSAGKFDFVPSVLNDLKVEKVFHKVAQRPGKPLWFGVQEGQTLVFGLPGNPVSCLVSLRRYVLGALHKMQKGSIVKVVHLSLGQNIIFKKELTYFAPVQIRDGLIYPLSSSGSGDYYSLSLSDGFIELPPGREEFHIGESYPFYGWEIN